MKSAILIHGKGGSPDASWLPWLKSKLESEGRNCVVPAFPPEDDSKLSDWFATLNKIDTEPANTVFVAHARGAMALLRWINTLPKDTRILKIVTVSCNFDFQPNRTDGDEFYTTRLDYEDIKNKSDEIVVIHSADDPYAPIEAGEQLAKNLNARFVPYEKAGHFGSDKTQAPEILKEI